jgi:hypothetical protein
VKLPHRHNRNAEEKAQFATELGVNKLYFVDEPLWYLRTFAMFHRSWRRELAFEACLLGAGLVVGFAACHI